MDNIYWAPNLFLEKEKRVVGKFSKEICGAEITFPRSSKSGAVDPEPSLGLSGHVVHFVLYDAQWHWQDTGTNVNLNSVSFLQNISPTGLSFEP